MRLCLFIGLQKSHGQQPLTRPLPVVDIGVCCWLSAFGRTQLVGCDGDGEAPVDECDADKEAHHEHVAYPSRFHKEECYETQEYSVDYSKPAVASVAVSCCIDKRLHAPEQEQEGEEIGEYHFRKEHVAHQHETDEHVDDSAGEPPAPSAASASACRHAELDAAGEDEEPSEDLRGHGVAGFRPEPVGEAADYHKYAYEQHRPPCSGSAEIGYIQGFHNKIS